MYSWPPHPTTPPPTTTTRTTVQRKVKQFLIPTDLATQNYILPDAWLGTGRRRKETNFNWQWDGRSFVRLKRMKQSQNQDGEIHVYAARCWRHMVQTWVMLSYLCIGEPGQTLGQSNCMTCVYACAKPEVWPANMYMPPGLMMRRPCGKPVIETARPLVRRSFLFKRRCSKYTPNVHCEKACRPTHKADGTQAPSGILTHWFYLDHLDGTGSYRRRRGALFDTFDLLWMQSHFAAEWITCTRRKHSGAQKDVQVATCVLKIEIERFLWSIVLFTLCKANRRTLR